MSSERIALLTFFGIIMGSCGLVGTIVYRSAIRQRGTGKVRAVVFAVGCCVIFLLLWMLNIVAVYKLLPRLVDFIVGSGSHGRVRALSVLATFPLPVTGIWAWYWFLYRRHRWKGWIPRSRRADHESSDASPDM